MASTVEDVYCSYYTKSDFITNYMVKMLDLNHENLILEPSAGDGAFIDALLKANSNVKVEAYDLNNKAVKILKQKYSNNPNIKIYESDTLMDEKLDSYVISNGRYDRVIGNPPWGAWQDYSRRKELKSKYKGHYAKETYSLFLLRGVSLLKENGILSFIVPDTFLFLHRHTKLRQFLLTNSKIKEIVIFPSKFFPGVQFGYSNICIITLQKASMEQSLENDIRIIKGLKQESDLEDIRLNQNIGKFIVKTLKQKEIYSAPDSSFLINEEDIVSEVINNTTLKLGDIADCVTGIYCGDNTRFMKVSSITVKGAKNYQIINDNEISDYRGLEGIDDVYRRYVPIVKGNSPSKYIREENHWYIDWSKQAIFHYKNDKKARFQNSQFYFKTGIAIPMVKSSKISATLIENMVFDQSVVGVFPKDEKYLMYLLGLLNSDVVRKIIQTINPTANNSANYIKKIPVILPDEEELLFINNLTKEIIEHIRKREYEEANQKHNEVNEFFKNMYF